MEIMNQKGYWVKMLIPKKQWSGVYSRDTSYCFLELANGDPIVGLCVAHFNPDKMKMCNDEDLRKIDLHRIANNVYPRPLTTISNEIDVDSLEL